MRAVIIGTDFVYDKQGNLKPIEINTNIGISNVFVEDVNNVYDFNELESFVVNNGFTKIVYIGPNVLAKFKSTLRDFCENLEIEFEHIYVSDSAITIPYVEDSETTLILRSSYDTTAILDDTYCLNKINYMNLIKDESFGSQFAYLDDNGTLISNITTIEDNGIHPNFIMKSILPHYNGEVWPKLYKVNNQTELNTLLNSITTGYFLMSFYFNENKLYNNIWTKIRKISLLHPPSLQSIHLGAYTDLAALKLRPNPIYDINTFELNEEFRNSYLANDVRFRQPKLMDDDYVVLADGTRKSGLDLQIGDILKTIDIPNPNNVDESGTTTNYQINLEEFLSGSVYSTNAVTKKERIETLTNIVLINFKDGTNWSDTDNSSYLVYSENEIKFKKIFDLVEGDIVLLIDTNDLNTIQIVQKEVDFITKVKEIFEGWIIEVERRHLFLTATDGPNNISPSFVAIEHNQACKSSKTCTTPPDNCCYKNECAVCIEPGS